MEKTKFIIIKSKFNAILNTNHDEIFINGQRIEQVNQYNNLGVKVDEYLTFSKHAEYATYKRMLT